MLYIVETSWSLIKPMLASTANNSAAYMMLGLAVHHAASCQAMTGAAQNGDVIIQMSCSYLLIGMSNAVSSST